MSFFAALLFCAVPGAFMAFVGVGHLWNYARLRQTDPVPVRELRSPSGAIELEGTARTHEHTSRSPFTDTRTLVHEWTVKEYVPSGSEGSSWSRLASGGDRHAFHLEDDTGTALIDVEGASPYLNTTTTIEVEGDDSPPPAVAQFLQSSDEVDREHSFTRRYTESRLDPGSPVHVYGPVRNDAPEADDRTSVDAIIGVDDPDRGFTVGEDSLTFSNLTELFTAEAEQFIVTNAGEEEAERKMLHIGLLFSGLGLLFLGIFGVVVVL
jgi:hypothetical protein